MGREFFCIAACLFALFGCASAPPASPPSASVWADQVFDYDPSLVTVSKEDLFQLDPELLEVLKSPTVQRMDVPMRLERIIALLYGREVKRFGYTAGHSTVAAETWRQRRGDCLSLTVLAYSMGRAMNLDAQMREVPIEVVFDRRDQLEFLSQHVNVLFRHTGQVDLSYRNVITPAHDIVLDFEPGVVARHIGEPLTDQAILARYYNNAAAEHMAKGRPALAYAHFKAAIQADPSFAASYGNLALLYRSKDLAAQAEQLLHIAVGLSKHPYVPMHALRQLMVDQGRHAEAAEIERQLQSRRDVDPNHWIALGVRHLQAGEYRAAIRALERAQKLTTGFEEVHQYLALAYWRAGERAQADQQLALLGALSRDGASVSRLHKKMNASP